MAIRILAGYISPNDAGKYDMIFDLDGPASYVNTGTFLTSGQQINASQLGVGGFEDIGSDMIASDGTSVVEVVPAAVGSTPAPAGPAGSVGKVFTAATLHWFNGVTRGTEFANLTNLSTKYIRLRAVCV